MDRGVHRGGMLLGLKHTRNVVSRISCVPQGECSDSHFRRISPGPIRVRVRARARARVRILRVLTPTLVLKLLTL